MKKILSILTVGCALTLSSCEDWLDKYPLAQMSPETFFSNENELQAFSNTFYTIFPGDGLYNEGYDNIVKNEIAAEMRDGRTIPASGGGWTWTDLRKFNTLLEYSGNCKDTDIRNRYDAVARFFRAYFYFEKVKRFGDVPWYAKPLGSADPELKRPRDSREFVMQRMIEDIDFAIRYLPAERDLYRVTKWTALALKSRFCLFEGTFRKYHSIDGYEHDWKWYLEQAADAAEEFITNSGYSLYTATGPATSYRDLFASENAQSVEVILARDYNSALGVFHNANFYTISASYGKPGMTRKIVDSYLMADGSRFTDKAGWETMEFKQQCSNRDPRLAQTIRTPGYTRIGATTKLAPDLANSITGYHVVKFVTGTAQDAYNKSFNDLPIFRSAEVYLNFAEAKAELGTLTQEDIDLAIKPLRDRAGVANLSLTKANASPDPYLASPETGYANVTGDNKGVILEIRRERTVELLMENLRYWDIMRWKEGKRFEKPFTGLYFPGTGSYDLNNDGVDDVCIWSGSKPATSAPAVYELNKEIFLSGGDSGYIIIHTDYARSWNEERDYLYPVPTDDRVLTQGAITQNPGWNDGLNF